MTEVFKGQSNLSQLEIRGNYRAVAAHDMAKVYSRNLAHRENFGSRLAHKASKENRNAESITTDPPGISEEAQAGKNPRTPNPKGENR